MPGPWFKTVDWSAGLLWLTLILTAVVVTTLAFAKKKEKVVQEIHLRDLSALWTKEGTRTIHISELSPLWRNEQHIAEENKSLDLRNPRADAFMEKIQ
ncbi:MAG: hypothetical protein KJ804_21640 [Proteobacteria bacterium]|nr:hypothetical protein [Pseudomonadota bacterium]MBU1060913.1 hypothetical protein [Pseudomonadota bacterium]